MKVTHVKREGCGCEAAPFCAHASNAVKHTPGPWHIAYGGQYADDYAIIGSKFSERAVCNMEPRDYVQANARLIAAAPELLEALKNANAFIESLLDATPDEATDFLTNNGENVSDTTRQAIRKAEGRA